jgi:alkaline phosphatase D
MTQHDQHRAGAGLTRRQALLRGAGVTAGALAGATFGGAWAWAAPPAAGRAVRDPFTLGVASGDPAADGVVLWTRLAPNPLADDGQGGMPDRIVPVQWQVAEDEGFGRVVAEGTELARPELGHSVHAEVVGLRPGAEYFYRFKTGPELSPVGRTRTAPAPGARVDRLAFAFTSCQAYTSGLFTAHRRMAEEDLDVVVQLGDYIYEGASNPSQFRVHEGQGEPVTLGRYRNRHAQYKGDADLQAAHAAFPWVVVLDDHEIDNNWADEVPQDPEKQSREAFLTRRRAALQAYYEHMPLRRAAIPRGIDIQLYRRLTFGDLLDVHVLDTRQYRSDQSTEARLDPTRTILGGEQERWLRDALAGPTARWNVLAQQVFFSQRDFTAGPGASHSSDAWDGYVADRDGLRDHLASAGTSNPVVITGDVHANYVCDVKADFDDPDSRTVATELVGTSISTGGNGRDQNPGDAVQLDENPHIHFINRNRGYVRNTITRSGWTADFRIVDSVTTPDAAVRTRATFVIEDGRPGAIPD